MTDELDAKTRMLREWRQRAAEASRLLPADEYQDWCEMMGKATRHWLEFSMSDLELLFDELGNLHERLGP